MPSRYDPQLGDLIKSMLCKRPEDRPDVKLILRQPYIKRQIAMFLEATKEYVTLEEHSLSALFLKFLESNIFMAWELELNFLIFIFYLTRITAKSKKKGVVGGSGDSRANSAMSVVSPQPKPERSPQPEPLARVKRVSEQAIQIPIILIMCYSVIPVKSSFYFCVAWYLKQFFPVWIRVVGEVMMSSLVYLITSTSFQCYWFYHRFNQKVCNYL